VTTAQILVTLAGLLGIAWVNWYFFLAGRARAATAGPDASGVQRIAVEVSGGYTPAVIRVRAGTPVRLEFHRAETNPCTEEVVIADFGIRTYLPAHRTTTVSFTPTPGSHEFTCGMGMVRGSIVAEDGPRS
jgi:plastocyanin domain-containing protein